MKKFTEDHEWVMVDAGAATVGITDHAQQMLGDLVFVDLPKVGLKFAKGAVVATVESVKAASDIYAPLSGEIIEINNALVERPGLANDSPMEGGWFFKLKITNNAEIEELLDEAAYATLAGSK